MSDGVRVDVECDVCRKVKAFAAPTVTEAHRLVDNDGWLRNLARDQDICPACMVDRVGAGVPGMLL